MRRSRSELPFDPVAHTQRVIDALDVHKTHGILAINASLQAGNAGYNRIRPLNNATGRKMMIGYVWST